MILSSFKYTPKNKIISWKGNPSSLQIRNVLGKKDIDHSNKCVISKSLNSIQDAVTAYYQDHCTVFLKI